MDYEVSPGEARSLSAPLRFIRSRVTAGESDTAIEVQFYIDVDGERQAYALPGDAAFDPALVNAIYIERPQDLSYFLGIKGSLGIATTDVEFMSDVAKGILGMFAASASVSYDTTYFVALSPDLAPVINGQHLPRGPIPFERFYSLGQITLRETTRGEDGSDR
jgi:hypothetical protein